MWLLAGCVLTECSRPVPQILLAAMQNGVPCTSLRIGQVCGSQATGAWGTSEWVPIIVKSSVTIGMLPELDGVRPSSNFLHASADLFVARLT